MDPREKVATYVHENVSRLLRVGEPKFDEEQGRWMVPVISDAGDRSEVIATYVLDRRLRFVRNPVKQLMDRLTDRLSGGKASDDDQTEGDSRTLRDEVAGPRPLIEHAQAVPLVDALTGLGTAAALLVRLDQEIERCRRYDTSFCVLFLDVENLWELNLQHGPLVADALIAQAGRAIDRMLRSGDFVAHWAGGRFAALMQGPKEQVLTGTARILGAVRGLQPVVRMGDRPLSVTAAMGGVACPPADPEVEMTPPALIKAARGMLMAAKAGGGEEALLT